MRRPGSIRRTSSIDVSWPEGRSGPMQLIGCARDIWSPPSGGSPTLLAQDSFAATLTPNRTIATIAAYPARRALTSLVGARAGGGLRQAIQDCLPDERAEATPLSLLLDDISGASLVSGWAWSQWDTDWLASARAAVTHQDVPKAFLNREGVCIGYAPGSSAFDTSTDRSGAPATDLLHPDDPEGWHRFPVSNDVSLRRARRIDLWRDGDNIVIDSAFQDSATTPGGDRAAVHEYGLAMTVNSESMSILGIEARPYVLPFAECPAAGTKLAGLVGTPLAVLREKVLADFRGTAGCTHLNAVLRALADTPILWSKHIKRFSA